MFRLLWKFMTQPVPRDRVITHPEVLRARQYFQAGELHKAKQVCTAVIAAEPKNADACNLMGGIASRQGNSELAIDCFAKAIRIDSRQAVFHQGLGFAYFNSRRFSEAVGSFKKAVSLEPKDASARNNLGNCYKDRGNFAEAVRCYRKAISLKPGYITAMLNLADTLSRQTKYDAAIDTYRDMLRTVDDTAENRSSLVLAYHRMGIALKKLGKPTAAIASQNEAIARDPDFALAHNSLGAALLEQNDPQAALEHFRKALAIEPDYAWAHSNFLLTANYLPEWTQDDLYQESVKFDLQHARGLAKGRIHLQKSRDKSKVLKIGYLSPDFRNHSVAHFTKKLPGSHNRQQFEVYCYANVDSPDDLTRHFQSQSDCWRSVVETNDEDTAQIIRNDDIDILVDLAGHTMSNRLMVLARKPAPVQVTWLGYPNTSGMRSINYRLTDAIADPPGEADRLHTETLVRLEHGFLCYQSDESNPAVSAPPCLKRNHITFGTFNSVLKITPEVITVWSEILASIPDSRLVVKSKALEDESTGSRFLQAFARHGIAPERLDLVAWAEDRAEHLDLYSGIDIGLDPFPYNGTTTTCEALWMGVPVICLRGDRHAGRVGASIMHHAGFPELIAESLDEYKDLAKTLSSDVELLSAQRKAQRSRIQRSALMNVQQFTESLESAYRDMWIKWCRKK